MKQTTTPAASASRHTPEPWHLSHQLADGFSIAREIAPNCGRLELFATVHTSGPGSYATVTDEQARERALKVIGWLNADPAAGIAALRELARMVVGLDCESKGPDDLQFVIERARAVLAGKAVTP